MTNSVDRLKVCADLWFEVQRQAMNNNSATEMRWNAKSQYSILETVNCEKRFVRCQEVGTEIVGAISDR